MDWSLISVKIVFAEQVPKFEPSVICCSTIIDLLATVDLKLFGKPKKTGRTKEVKPLKATVAHRNNIMPIS